MRGYVKVSSEGLNSVSTAGNKGCTTSTTGTDDVEGTFSCMYLKL